MLRVAGEERSVAGGEWAVGKPLAALVLFDSLATFGWCASFVKLGCGALFLSGGLIAIPFAGATLLAREWPLGARFGIAARVGYFVLLVALGVAVEGFTLWALLTIFWGRGGFVD